jgi:hypothetical protein
MRVGAHRTVAPHGIANQLEGIDGGRSVRGAIAQRVESDSEPGGSLEEADTSGESRWRGSLVSGGFRALDGFSVWRS